MKRYTVRSYVGFGEGTVLFLSEEQIRRRSHLLEELGAGRVRVTLRKANFFPGETLGFEGEAPAYALRHLEAEGPGGEAPPPAAGTSGAPGGGGAGEELDEEERLRKIRDASTLLAEDDYDAKRRPKVGRVSELAGFKTTRAEIEAALAGDEEEEEGGTG